MKRTLLLSLCLLLASTSYAVSANDDITVKNGMDEPITVSGMVRVKNNASFGIGGRELSPNQTANLLVGLPEWVTKGFGSVDIYVHMDPKRHGGSAAGCRTSSGRPAAYVVRRIPVYWCRLER